MGLEILVNRPSGTKYKVVNDQFVEMNWEEKILYFFSKEYRSPIQKAVKAKIITLIENQDRTLPLQDYYPIFKKALAPLSQAIFNHQEFKNSEFYQAIQQKIKTFNQVNLQRELIHDDQYWNTWAEAQMADWLGHSLRRNFTGTSGSYIAYDLSGKKVGLIKPVSESPHGPKNPHFKIKVRNAVQRTFSLLENRCVKEELGAKHEEFSSRIDETIHFNLVPKTHEGFFLSSSFYDSTLNFESISFQRWAEHKHNGFDHLHIFSFYPPFIVRFIIWMRNLLGLTSFENRIDDNSFKKYALLQFAISNIDSNLGNMLFDKAEGSNLITSIDAWFSMPSQHPECMIDTRILHTWRTLPHSEKTIKPEDLKPLLDHEEELLQQIDILYPPESKEDIKQCFKDRFKVMKIASHLNRTFTDLADLSTKDAMSAFIKKYDSHYVSDKLSMKSEV